MSIDRLEATRLNLGCGADILDGYVNVDLVRLDGVDVVHDMNVQPWPFEENSFDEIVANHVLEHLDDVIGALREIWRVSKPGGIIKIRTPYFASFLTFKDLTHKHVFTYDAFDNWDVRNFEKGRYVTHMDEPMRFKIRRRRILMFSRCPGVKYYLANLPFVVPTILINLFPRLYERFFFFYLPASNIYFEIEVVKT